MIFALVAPVLFCAVGLAVDVAYMSMTKSRLQATADSAALSGAREFALASASKGQIDAAVASFINIEAKQSGKAVAHTAGVDFRKSEVTVEVELSWSPFFAHFFDSKATPVRARAKARLLHESTKVCVLALNPNGAKAIHLEKTSRITANDCSIYVNSAHRHGLQVEKEATITSKLTCVAGGYTTAKQTSITPTPLTDCPALQDPLGDRPPPDFAGCDHNEMKVHNETKTLGPGVYCGGLEITGTAKVKFKPGTYIIKDKRLLIQGDAIAEGNDVGFYLAGQSYIEFTNNATVRLSGAESGEMAGLLFFQDRTAKLGNKNRINCSGAEKLVGTIYLPRGQLYIDPNAMVAAESAYTAIVAYELALSEGPSLVLNADYGATDVPVPTGIKTSGTVVLTQ